MITKRFRFIQILVLSVLIFGSARGTSYQQVLRNKPPRWSAYEKARKLSAKQVRRLKLNSQQAKQIRTINSSIGKRVDRLKESPGLNASGRMDRFKSLMDQRDNAYKKILNSDQFKKWNDWQIRRKELVKAYPNHRRRKMMQRY